MEFGGLGRAAMADLTQSLYSAEEKLRSRGIQAKVIAKPTDGREADPEVGKVSTLSFLTQICTDKVTHFWP